MHKGVSIYHYELLLIFFIVTMVKPRSGFKELFEEFSESSHLRDALLMLLGFSPMKILVSMCIDVMNVFLLYC